MSLSWFQLGVGKEKHLVEPRTEYTLPRDQGQGRGIKYFARHLAIFRHGQWPTPGRHSEHPSLPQSSPTKVGVEATSSQLPLESKLPKGSSSAVPRWRGNIRLQPGNCFLTPRHFQSFFLAAVGDGGGSPQLHTWYTQGKGSVVPPGQQAHR